MAIKRLRPVQDTFICENDSQASFGADEVLELGTCLRHDSHGCSRILMEFMTNEVDALLGDHSLIRAVLNLKYATADKLPPIWGIDYCEIGTEWAEGLGHVYDIPGDPYGASWYRPKGIDKEEYWDGGLQVGEEVTWKHDYFTDYQANKDICLDVTEYVYSWICNGGQGLGFLIKLSNEELAEKMGTRICFYGSESHTIYKPYLELIYDDFDDDKEVPEGTPIADPNNMVVGVKNLKESYYIGDRVRLDLLVRPEFPIRQYSTSSLYRDTGALLPEKTLWGIRDEYTGEMLVNFSDIGTQIGFDEKGNFMVLDTDLLEPERYYRLLFEFDNGEIHKIYDSKNIFRVTRNGEL